MRRRLTLLIVLLGAGFVFARTRSKRAIPGPAPTPASVPASAPAPASPSNAAAFVDSPSIANAVANHSRDVPVNGVGVVSRVLPDDREGERHQRVIVRLPSGGTVLLAYNIDIAPRIEGLQSGAPIEFQGEYVWNSQGGVVHWTHHDPSGRHKPGFVKYNGHTYR